MSESKTKGKTKVEILKEIREKENAEIQKLRKLMATGVKVEGAVPCPFCKYTPIKMNYSSAEDRDGLYMRCFCGVWSYYINKKEDESEDDVYEKLKNEWNRRLTYYTEAQQSKCQN